MIMFYLPDSSKVAHAFLKVLPFHSIHILRVIGTWGSSEPHSYWYLPLLFNQKDDVIWLWQCKATIFNGMPCYTHQTGIIPLQNVPRVHRILAYDLVNINTIFDFCTEKLLKVYEPVSWLAPEVIIPSTHPKRRKQSDRIYRGATDYQILFAILGILLWYILSPNLWKFFSRRDRECWAIILGKFCWGQSLPSHISSPWKWQLQLNTGMRSRDSMPLSVVRTSLQTPLSMHGVWQREWRDDLAASSKDIW